MKFAEVIVLDVLEKRGYISASMSRTSSLCRWYIARKGQDLYEVEAYDSQSSGSEELKQYIESLLSMPDANPFIRKPLDIVSDRGITCVIRKHFAGEPLHTCFIRPGSLTEEKASLCIKSFEGIHKYLQSQKLDNFAPLSIMFFLTEEGTVFLDGLKCGPWVKNYEHLTLISNYLNPELPWDKQVSFFRNAFALKLFLGDPKAEECNEQRPQAVRVFLDGIFTDRDAYQDSLSALEKKYRKRPKGFLLKASLVTAILLLPILAYFFRVIQLESSWLGAAYVEKPAKEKAVEDRDEFAFEPDAEEEVEISHQFIQKSLMIKEMMLAGNFKNALDQITELSSINLRKKELDILNEIRTIYPKRRKMDFENAVLMSKRFLAQDEYAEAVVILEDIVDRYKKGEDTEKALILIAEVKELEIFQKLKQKEDLEKKEASIEKDKLMVQKLDKLQSEEFFKPVNSLAALNRRLDLIRLECVTTAAKYLVSCNMKLNSAEKRLYEQLLQFSTPEDKEKKMKLLLDNVAELEGLEIYDVSESGVKYGEPAGGGDVKFVSMPPQSMYHVFRQTSSVDVERAAYYLYLYCLKYGLQKESEVEFKLIKNDKLLKEADSLRDMKQARRDLFAKSN